MSNKCIFVTSLPPKYSETINNCLVSWKKYKKDIFLIQNKNEISNILNIYPGHDFTIIESKTPIDYRMPKWSKPYLPNIIDFINLTEFYDVIIINSDIYLNYSPEEFEEKWTLNNNKSFICGTRTNYDEEFQQLLYFDPSGIDIFKLPKDTYKYFKNTFSPFLIGMPAWDWWLLCKLFEFEFELKVEKFNFNILHKIHDLNWDNRDYEYGLESLSNPYFQRKYGIENNYQWSNFVQLLTGRQNWENEHRTEKTFEFLKVFNISQPFQFTHKFVLYSMFGSLSNLLIKNLVNIIIKIDKKYVNMHLLHNYTHRVSPIKLKSLISGDISSNNSCFNLFYFRDPNDVLVSRYLDFIQNPNVGNPIEKIPNLNNSISEYRKQMKNLTIDEFVLQEALSLKEDLNQFIGKSNNSNFSFKILYYEDIIDNKLKLCASFHGLFSKIYKSKLNLEDIFDSFIWASDEDKKDSMEVGYHKKVLQKETVEILNSHFKEINKFFYEKKQDSNFLSYS